MPKTKRTSYTTVRNSFNNKICAYRTLLGQTIGSSTKYRPTPTQLNTFSRWIDKGACVYNVTNAQLNRWSGTNRNWTVTTAKSTLTGKFGKTCIKAVAYNKSGGFIVATATTNKNRTFKFW